MLSTAVKRAWLAMLLAGLLPIGVVHLAFAINIADGLAGCVPYWEGCLSVSRGVRSGPGLWWFKALAIPSMVLMWLSWSAVRVAATAAGFEGRRVPWLVALGRIGAVFFLVYALWLGTDGEVYRWLRRYGVVFYFGLTGLAHLLLLAAWPRVGRAAWAYRGYAFTVFLTWATGVASAFKRKLIDDPQFLDRVENALEWHFALYLSLSFAALAIAWRGLLRSREGAGTA